MISFQKCQIHSLNKILGGVKDCTWTSRATGIKYKDYKYEDNEVNATHSTANCTVTGGTDKTFETP